MQAESFNRPPVLHSLLRFLNGLSGRVDLEELGTFLRELSVTPADLSPHIVFSDSHYMRNKIATSPWFDLLAICWRPGQGSTIHDHTASSCGFKIVQGTATELLYLPVPGRKGSVSPTGIQKYEAGEVCLAEDEAIHRIVNASKTENLITLHVYSPPLRMNHYELDDGLKDLIPVPQPASARMYTSSPTAA